MKLIGAHNILNGAANLRVPAGSYAGFMFRIAATAQAAQDLTAIECGLMTLLYKGLSKQSVAISDLQDVNNALGGIVEEDVAVGGACEFVFYVPASLYADQNVFDVREEDNMFFRFDLSGVSATNVASGTLNMYGILASGVQKFFPTCVTQTPSIPANGTFPLTIPLENVTHVFVSGLTNASRIAVLVDGESRVEGNTTDLLNLSNATWQFETAPTTFIGLRIAPHAFLNDALSDNVVIQLTAGSGGAWAPNVIAFGLDMTPDNMARSKAAVEAQTTAILTRKSRDGKTRPVQVARALRGNLPV